MGENEKNNNLSFNIRKIIFENFNDIDKSFTNDEIFEFLKNENLIEKSVTIDDLEKNFQQICNCGLVRNIAQNFTTMHFKLFEKVEKIICKTCNNITFLGGTEEKICTNPDCRSNL